MGISHAVYQQLLRTLHRVFVWSTVSTQGIDGPYGHCSFGHVLELTMTRLHFGVLCIATTCGLTGLYGVTTQMLAV